MGQTCRAGQVQGTRKSRLLPGALVPDLLSQYGSLYYRSDLDPSSPILQYTDKDGNHAVDERFAVGPSVSRQNVDDGRAKLDFNRGPWDTVDTYERATGEREAYCIKNMEQLPRSPIAIHYLGTYQPSRETKLFAIESYLKVVNFLLPEDRTYQRPVSGMTTCMSRISLSIQRIQQIYATLLIGNLQSSPRYTITPSNRIS